MRQTFILFVILIGLISCTNQNKDSNRQFPNVQLGKNVDFIGLDKQTGWYRTRLKEPHCWGFIDKDSVVKIPFVFKYINPFDTLNMTNGQIGDKFGYINTNFDTIIPFKYEELRSLNHGLAHAELNGMHGFLNRKGETMIPFVYDDAKSFENCGIAEVSIKGKWGCIDTKGNEVIPIKYSDIVSHRMVSLLFVSKNNKWAIFNHQGEQCSEFIYDEIYGTYKNFDYHNSKYLFKGLLLVRKGNQYRYLNRNLEIVIDFGYYSKAEPITEYGFAIVKKGNYGIINSKGDLVMPCIYPKIEHPRKEYQGFYDEFYIYKNGEVGLLSREAKPITDITYTSFECDYSYDNGNYHILFVARKNNKCGLIGSNGEIIMPIEYDEIGKFESNSCAIAKKNGLYGIINNNGKVKIPFEYTSITTYHLDDNYVVEKNGKYGIIKKEPLDTIIPLDYDDLEVCFYDETHFIVNKSGKYGIIDNNLKIIVPFEYDKISNWVEYGPKEHFVVKDGKEGLIGRDGEIVIPPVYDKIFVDNGILIKVEKKGFYGTISWKNEIIHPIEYENILWEWPFLTGKPIDTIYIEKSGKYFATDIKGKIIIESVSKELIDERFGYLMMNK